MGGTQVGNATFEMDGASPDGVAEDGGGAHFLRSPAIFVAGPSSDRMTFSCCVLLESTRLPMD